MISPPTDHSFKDATLVAEAISTGGREGSLRSAERPDSSTFLDPGAKPNPELLFAGAYAACFHSALISVAKALGLPLTDAEVRARVGQTQDEAGDSRLIVELHGKLPGVAEPKALEWMQTAHKICPYSRALQGNVLVSLVVDSPSQSTEKPDSTPSR